MEEIMGEKKITSINKAVTKKIINQADQKAVRLEIYDINEGDNVVTCRLYDKDDKLLTGKRVFDLGKLPCELITNKEMEILFPVKTEKEISDVR